MSSSNEGRKGCFSAVAAFFKAAKKPLIAVASLLCGAMIAVGIADGIQKDWGKIEVTTGTIETTIRDVYNVDNSGDPNAETVSIGYKLYKPKTASSTNKAPAALCLHGYQNDHETSAAYALELARRGYVALAIDEYGHGATNKGMIHRGYVNHKVTTNYGYDEDGKTYLEIGGVTRYKIMMNFSNLSFFIDKYSKSYDFDNNATISTESVKDSSMGGSAAYGWLSTLDCVDNTKMVVTGHSMGTWAAWTVSAAYSGTPIEPRATTLQCGELFKTTRDLLGRLAYDSDEDGIAEVHWNNFLLLTAKYDEFNYFRDYAKTVVTKDSIKNEQSLNFLNVPAEEAEWNKTFHENFATGTSVRREYIVTNHRLTTHDAHAIRTTMEWFDSSTAHTSSIASTNQTFMVKELLVFAAMLMAITSVVAVVMCFKYIKWFEPVFAGVPNRPEKLKKGWKFWKGAIITILISFATYPFLCQLGHGLMPLPEKLFRMTIGNGFLVWYIFLILVMLGFTLIPWFVQKKKGTKTTDFVDLGFARDDEQHKNKFDWVLLGKSAIVVVAGILWMYIQVAISQAAFQLDFRFIWPFFKTFSLTRLGQFFVYLPIFLVFFILNNSRIFAAQRVEGVDEAGVKGFFKCWWKYALCMVGGILLLCLLEYIPFFAQIGPGADLAFGSTFGGPFMSLLIVFAPQVIVFSFVCTYCYRKTGNAFVGAMIVAILACWIVTGGSAILY